MSGEIELRIQDIEAPPEGMKFYLNAATEVWVKFTNPKDCWTLPAKHEVVVSCIRALLLMRLGRHPSETEFRDYKDRCYASAIVEFRDRPDNEDLRLERNTLVSCTLDMMVMRAAGWRHMDGEGHHGKNVVPEAERYEWIGNQTRLRAELALFNEPHGVDWPPVHRGGFGEYLEDHRAQLYENGIVLTFVKQRRAKLRPVMLSWRDIMKIPEYLSDEMDEKERLGILNRKLLKERDEKMAADFHRILDGQ